MSEYWVSKKKYFCKYCEIFIADDAPSRQQHENGLRHQGNKDRFIRGLYKAGEKRKRDLEEEKREMAKVEQAAHAAFSQDVGAGLAKPSTSGLSAPTATAPRKPAQKPSNPFANYTTAESLGYKDPDIERLAAEAELHRSQGVAGEWQIVAPPPPSSAPPTDKPEAGTLAESLQTEGETTTDARAFKLQKRIVTPGLGEIYDPGIIPIQLKKQEPETSPAETSPDALKPPEPLKWIKVEWKRSGENVKRDGESTEPTTSTSSLPETVKSTDASKWSKVQWSNPAENVRQEGEVVTAISSEMTAPQTKMEATQTRDVNGGMETPEVLEDKDNIAMKPEEIPLTLPTPESAPAAGLFRKRKTLASASSSKWRRQF